MTRLLPLMALLLLAACGEAPASSPAAASSAPGASVSASEAGEARPLRYTCGGHPFAPEVFEEPEVDLAASEAGQALRDLIASGQHAGLIPEAGWRVAGSDAATTTFVAAVPGDPPYAHAQAELVDGEWMVPDWGQCRPLLAIDDLNAATWRLPRDEAIGPGTTVFRARVTEIPCVGGQPSDDRLQPPIVVYGEETVLVAFVVTPPADGGGDCPGNPPASVEVELREPLGNRILLDGGVLPPHDPDEPWPPSG